MDIFAHGLWTGAAARYANLKHSTERSQGDGERRFSVWLAVFWGVIPDLFAFTIPFIVMAARLATGEMSLSDFGPPEDGGDQSTIPMYWLSHSLYNISHSTVVFAAAFGLVWFIKKRPVWEMLGWLLHIFIDIPTHTSEFFPTPVFWPLFKTTFSGISWGTTWFMATNYTLLIAVYIWLSIKTRAKDAAVFSSSPPRPSLPPPGREDTRR